MSAWLEALMGPKALRLGVASCCHQAACPQHLLAPPPHLSSSDDPLLQVLETFELQFQGLHSFAMTIYWTGMDKQALLSTTTAQPQKTQLVRQAM